MNSKLISLTCSFCIAFSFLTHEAANGSSMGFEEKQDDSRTLLVATQNLWKRSTEETLNYFKKINVDVLCAQEAQNIDPEKVKEAGLNIHKFANNGKGPCCIISKYPFETISPNRYGVHIRLDKNLDILVMACHTAHMPYGPYQLNGIPYGSSDAKETQQQVLISNRNARKEFTESVIEEINNAETPFIILCGDFNEPSWLDWTKETTEAGLSVCELEWPTTKRLWDKGLKGDAYRTVHPNPVEYPGFTWSSKPAEKDTEDRIDLILYNTCKDISVKECKVIGENKMKSDIVITPWIFDHRGVWAKFEFKTKGN